MLWPTGLWAKTAWPRGSEARSAQIAAAQLVFKQENDTGAEIYTCKRVGLSPPLGRHNRAYAMHSFLSNNRDELIARCKAKVAQRAQRAATPAQLANGIPIFLEQLTRTLIAEEDGDVAEGERISGPSGGDITALSQIGVSATAHGHELMELGYSVDQVVHDYGDLCQAITDLAVERDAPFSVDQYRTLNRCLDNAIADAVTEFSAHRDLSMSRQHSAGENERLGFLVHELRNLLQTATMAFTALELGKVPIGGATGALLKRSLGALSGLLERSLGDVKAQAGTNDVAQAFPLSAFVADAKAIALLGANHKGCALIVPEVDASIGIAGTRDHLLAALVNLLQNAFKFTQPHTEVTLHAYAADGRVVIEVKDHCGGLPSGFAEKMFRPFTQGSTDRSGLGLGLSIARRSVEADGGNLTVRDVPGTGCVFTMSLPRHPL
jgi:signal transduction histidine kinase